MSPLTEPTRLTLAKGQPVPNDPYLYTNTVLLLHGDGANGSTDIVDSSRVAGSPKVVTPGGNAQISTAVADPFGNSTGVIAFDGTGDYLTIPSSIDFEFGTGDFTIEMWWRRTSDSAGGLIDLGFNYGGIGIYQQPTNNLYVRINGINVLTTTSFSVNQWVHLALSRSGSSLRLFFNGAQQGSTVSNSTNLVNTFGTVAIGAYVFNGSYAATPSAYLNDLRITKGVARYTSNFTPPTAPFPDF